MHARHGHAGILGDELAIALQVAGLELVVGLLLELPLRLADDLGDVELDGQDARQAQQAGQVVDVAVDAAGDAGVLDLERQLAAVPRDGPVHLPDGGGRDRLEVELAKALLPALAVGAAQHAPHLGGRHGVRRGAQHRQRVGELGRQQVVALEGEELPQLHRRTAHRGQPARELLGPGPGEEGRHRVRAAGAHGALRALGDSAEGELSGHPADARQALQAPRRHPAAAAPPAFLAHSASLAELVGG